MADIKSKGKNILKRYPIILHLLLMIGISAVLVVAISIFVKIYSRQGQEYEMTNLIGKTMEEAELANDLELRYVVTDSIFESDNEPGTILTQDPQPGDKVKKGRKIYLTIASVQPEDVVMPDLTNMSLRQAVSQLMSNGLSIKKLRFVDSQYRNLVQGQSINGRAVAAGKKIPRGTAIELTVGRGTDNKGTIVEVVIGKTHEEAQRTLYSASLNILEHFEGCNRSTGKIYKQDPVCSDEKHPLGTTVEVWYCASGEYNKRRKAADFEIDSLRRVTDSINRAEEAAAAAVFEGTNFDVVDDDMIW